MRFFFDTVYINTDCYVCICISFCEPFQSQGGINFIVLKFKSNCLKPPPKTIKIIQNEKRKICSDRKNNLSVVKETEDSLKLLIPDLFTCINQFTVTHWIYRCRKPWRCRSCCSRCCC